MYRLHVGLIFRSITCQNGAYGYAPGRCQHFAGKKREKIPACSPKYRGEFRTSPPTPTTNCSIWQAPRQKRNTRKMLTRRKDNRFRGWVKAFLNFLRFFWRGGEFCCFLQLKGFLRGLFSSFSSGLFVWNSICKSKMERNYPEGFFSCFSLCVDGFGWAGLQFVFCFWENGLFFGFSSLLRRLSNGLVSSEYRLSDDKAAG